MHDVVKMCEEICVWRDVLPPLHDPADQLVGMKLTLLITLWQHGGLQTITHTLNDQWKETEFSYHRNPRNPLTCTYLKEPGCEDSQGWDQTRGRGG